MPRGRPPNETALAAQIQQCEQSEHQITMTRRHLTSLFDPLVSRDLKIHPLHLSGMADEPPLVSHHPHASIANQRSRPRLRWQIDPLAPYAAVAFFLFHNSLTPDEGVNSIWSARTNCYLAAKKHAVHLCKQNTLPHQHWACAILIKNSKSQHYSFRGNRTDADLRAASQTLPIKGRRAQSCLLSDKSPAATSPDEIKEEKDQKAQFPANTLQTRATCCCSQEHQSGTKATASPFSFLFFSGTEAPSGWSANDQGESCSPWTGWRRAMWWLEVQNQCRGPAKTLLSSWFDRWLAAS